MRRHIRRTHHVSNVCAAVDTAADCDFGYSNNDSGFSGVEEDVTGQEVAADAGDGNHDVARAKEVDNDGLVNPSAEVTHDNDAFLENYDLVDTEGDTEDPNDPVNAIDHYINAMAMDDQSEVSVTEQAASVTEQDVVQPSLSQPLWNAELWAH